MRFGIRIFGGLGCGGRGTGVTSSFIEHTGAVVTAIGDIFERQLAPAKESLDKVSAKLGKPPIASIGRQSTPQ